MPAPYQHSGADIAFWILFAAFLLGEWAIRFRSRRNPSGRPAERWTLLVVAAAIGVGALGAFLLAGWNAAEIGARWPVFGLGLALMAVGTGLRQWAVLTLGRFFTMDVRVHDDQRVVDQGPYRWVRHPSYTGIIIFFLGLGLALTNWASLALLAVVPTAAIIVRIHAEENALLTGLGEPYRRYAATHRRLLPGVW